MRLACLPNTTHKAALPPIGNPNLKKVRNIYIYIIVELLEGQKVKKVKWKRTDHG